MMRITTANTIRTVNITAAKTMHLHRNQLHQYIPDDHHPDHRPHYQQHRHTAIIGSNNHKRQHQRHHHHQHQQASLPPASNHSPSTQKNIDINFPDRLGNGDFTELVEVFERINEAEAEALGPGLELQKSWPSEPSS